MKSGRTPPSHWVDASSGSGARARRRPSRPIRESIDDPREARVAPPRTAAFAELGTRGCCSDHRVALQETGGNPFPELVPTLNESGPAGSRSI